MDEDIELNQRKWELLQHIETVLSELLIPGERAEKLHHYSALLVSLMVPSSWPDVPGGRPDYKDLWYDVREIHKLNRRTAQRPGEKDASLADDPGAGIMWTRTEEEYDADRRDRYEFNGRKQGLLRDVEVCLHDWLYGNPFDEDERAEDERPEDINALAKLLLSLIIPSSWRDIPVISVENEHGLRSYFVEGYPRFVDLWDSVREIHRLYWFIAQRLHRELIEKSAPPRLLRPSEEDSKKAYDRYRIFLEAEGSAPAAPGRKSGVAINSAELRDIWPLDEEGRPCKAEALVRPGLSIRSIWRIRGGKTVDRATLDLFRRTCKRFASS